jgi:hypothetical protein
MRTSLIVALLALGLFGIALHAQDKAADGEYEMRSVSTRGASLAKTATRWVLTRTPGGYHLESEIQNQPAGMRVVQIEELNEGFAPVRIGYALYRNDQKDPGITATCEFSNGPIICSGMSGTDRAAPSEPYKPSGPFWLWMEGLFSLDMPWLLDGAVNMAHLDKGKANIATLTVSGGSAVMIGDAVSVAKLEAVKTPGQTLTVIAPDKPIPWGFSSDEESPLEFIGIESLDVGGAKLAAKHYTFTNGNQPTNLWIAGSGLLIKMADAAHGEVLLANYKQYKKFIPELPVEPQPATSAPPQKAK